MIGLRRAWVWAIACAAVLAGGGVLVMRFELLDPAPTLAPETFGHALGMHGMLSLAVLFAALLAISVLLAKRAVVLGVLALVLWAVAIATLVGLGLRGSPSVSPHAFFLVLAASLVLGAAQLAVSQRVNELPVVATLVAIAIVVVPLVRGELPTAMFWLLATTAVAGGLIPEGARRMGWTFVLLAIVPCLVLAWVMTGLAHPDDTIHLHDTVAVLSPLPVTGAAMFAALLVAATRSRMPHRQLAHVAAALITAGATLTSVGFFALGARGFPRRYFAYLPEYQSLQVVVGVAAVIAMIGGVVAAEAFRRGSVASPGR